LLQKGVSPHWLLSNFRRAHLLGGTCALVSLVWMGVTRGQSLAEDGGNALMLISSIGIGGYFLGFVVGGLLNGFLYLIRSDKDDS
jgi:hypothetical protein